MAKKVKKKNLDRKKVYWTMAIVLIAVLLFFFWNWALVISVGMIAIILTIAAFVFLNWKIGLIVLFLSCGAISSTYSYLDESIKERNDKQFWVYIENEKFYDARKVLDKGNIKNLYTKAQALIEKFSTIRDAESAVAVYEQVFVSGNYYEPYDSNKKECAEACVRYVYKVLVETGNFKKAWSYYPIDGKVRDAACNAPNYYQYMSNVIIYLCKNKNVRLARRFLNDNVDWFLLNVDNAVDGVDYYEFSYESAKNGLSKIISEYE